MSVLKHLRKKRPAPVSCSFELGRRRRRRARLGVRGPALAADLGRTAWLLVGVFALLAGVAWLLGTTETIVGPVVAGTIIATVAMPVVSMLARHMPRAAAAALVLLALVALAVVVVVIVIGGITSQHDSISDELDRGRRQGRRAG